MQEANTIIRETAQLNKKGPRLLVKARMGAKVFKEKLIGVI